MDAEKAVMNDNGLNHIPLNVVKIILPEIYKHWLKKRKYIEKPLIRYAYLYV